MANDPLGEHIRKLRDDFSHGALDESDVHRDPSEQFRLWMAQAVESQVPEVQAMQLCTVSKSMQPTSRVVYLREFGHHEFTFYTNYNSRKAKELEENPMASIAFFWPQIERQVRIEGTVARSPAAQSDSYFNLRPYESKLGAWASNQSGELASRRALEEKIDEVRKKFPADKIKRPDFWGGLTLTAHYYEFWQGRKSRLHDRISYRSSGGQWVIQRLAP